MCVLCVSPRHLSHTSHISYSQQRYILGFSTRTLSGNCDCIHGLRKKDKTTERIYLREILSMFLRKGFIKKFQANEKNGKAVKKISHPQYCILVWRPTLYDNRDSCHPPPCIITITTPTQPH